MRVLSALVMLSASMALADIPPPDTSGCSGKIAGASCKRDDASEGVCTKSTCSRNDYSNGPPPKQVDYECLQCGESKAPPAPEKKSCSTVPGVTVLLALAWFRRRSSDA